MKPALRTTVAAVRLILLGGCVSALLSGQSSAQQSTVTYPSSVQISSPLSSAPPASAAPATGQRPLAIPLHALPQGQPVPGSEHVSDRAAQTNAAHVLEALPQANFGGITQDGYIPPDPNIAVSATQIVEMVNSELAIYDKSGNLAAGYPKSLSSLWTNLGGACGNSGDPVVQYDRLADRWFISQLQSLSSPYGECIAVSTTGDAGGTYHLYFYNFGSNLNDYPKFGVWPTASNSAYLGTYNLFANGANFVGADLCAYDRAAMLNGQSAAQICFTRSTADGGFLPSDLDGATPPADGEPGYFLAYNASTQNSLTLYKMALNFGAGGPSATLSAAVEIPVAAFSPGCGGGTCIPQPSTSRNLDSLGDRLMYRLAYRNFGAHQSMVVNHSVTSPQGTVAPRWYLLDATSQGVFGVAQQGTYAPDSAYRWMGSIAMDQSGDILLGYSRSSSTSFPSIYVAGRVPGDAAGTLSQEISLLNGGGSQTMYTRWGDYTAMRIDPADDCTFWYVNEYLPQTSFGNWYTYIGSHKITGCGSGGGGGSPDFGLSVTPASLTVNAGSDSGSGASVTVTSMNDFNAQVTFTTSCSGLISCSASPATPPKNSTASSTLTVAVASGADAGTITETVTGNSGATSHNTSFTLTVPASDFGITATALSPIHRSASGSTTITLTDKGLSNSSTSLSVSGLPKQTSATFSPTTVKVNTTNPVSSTLTIKVGRNAPRGTYPLTVTGTNSGYSETTQVSLTIQ